MPPRFEAPEPVVADISRAYGAAESMLRSNPVLANAAESAARMRQASNLAAADRAFRAQQADLDRAESVSQRSTAAMGRLAGINAESQQNEFDREARQRLQLQDFQARAAQQQFAAQAEAKTQEGLMVLRSQLARQDFTYQDQIELTRQNRVLQDIMDNDELTDQEKAFAGLAVKSGAKGIDVLEMRQRRSQQRMQEAHAKQYEEQAKLQGEVLAKQSAFDARAQYQNVEYVIDPAAKAELERTLPPPTAEDVARYGSAAEARRHQVAAAAAAQGKLYGIREQTGVDNMGRPVYQRSEVKKPESAGIDAKQAQEAGALATKTVNDMVAARAKAELPLDDWMKTPEGVAGKAVEVARASALAARAYADTLAGRPPQGQGGGAEASQSPNPTDWDAGFDTSKPATPAQRAFTEKNVADFHRIQNDPRMTQEQKDPYLKLLREALALAAAPGKTPEQKQRLREILQAPEPQPAAAPGSRVEPVNQRWPHLVASNPIAGTRSSFGRFADQLPR